MKAVRGSRGVPSSCSSPLCCCGTWPQPPPAESTSVASRDRLIVLTSRPHVLMTSPPRADQGGRARWWWLEHYRPGADYDQVNRRRRHKSLVFVDKPTSWRLNPFEKETSTSQDIYDWYIGPRGLVGWYFITGWRGGGVYPTAQSPGNTRCKIPPASSSLHLLSCYAHCFVRRKTLLTCYC